jgi:ribonuclease D
LQPFKNTSVNDLEYADGHGLDTRNGKVQRNKNIPDDVIAPKVHYLHLYHDEISSFQCDPSDLTNPYDKNKIPLHGLGGTLFNSSMSRVEGIWIDNESDLIELCDRILREDIREIAIDLEAHSYRSFSGFVCLMQISLRRPSRPSLSSGLVPENEGSMSTAYDFLIDTLCLRKVINSHLAPIFANPDILKVMHGANSDIQWLQRDFGIYVINLFDTGIATRYLPHLGSHGLAKILSIFANVQSDKKHQLSDWRERPLRQEMRSYAVSDTIYLLDLYDRLKLELSIHNRQPDIVQVVFEESKQICLLRYDKEPFYPSAYKRLINWRKENSTTDDLRENVLKELFDWRDRIARELDESLHYVCPDAILVRVAFNCPVAISALQAIIKPMPPLVLSHASEIIDLIRSEASPQSAHNKVLISNSSANTEKSVQCEDNFNSSDVNNIKEEGDLPSDIEEEEMIERNVVEVHSANKDFTASSYTPHSAEMLHLPPEGDVDDKMSISACTRGQTVDGLGAITSALASEQESAPSGVSINNTIKDEWLEAKKSAVQIHQKITESYSNKFKWNQPIAASSDSKIYHDDESDESVGSNIQDNNERDNALPRSLREIYRCEKIFIIVFVICHQWLL